jgi:hypothetical protein
MGAEAEGDMMKTEEEDMHTEFRASQIGEGTNLDSGPAFDQEVVALLAYFYWEARGCPRDSLGRTGLEQNQSFAIGSPLRFHPFIGAATPKTETQETWEAYLQEARGALHCDTQPRDILRRFRSDLPMIGIRTLAPCE